MSNRRPDLHALGYTQQWFDFGILTEAKLQTQLTTFNCGEDTHTEHYRYQTLRGYINTRLVMTDNEVGNFLELVTNDPDSSMASSAIILLLKKVYLTDKQFETISQALTIYGAWTQKEITLQRDRRSNATSRDCNN